MITGADGFIGSRLTVEAVRCGHQTDVVARRRAPDGITQRYTTLNPQDMDLQGVDCILHLAGLAHERGTGAVVDEHRAVNAEASLALLQAAVQAQVGTFVYLSSFKVLGDTSRAPLAVDAAYQPEGAYAQSKVEAEQLILDAPPSTTRRLIVRPPLTYGPGVRANFLSLLRWADSPWPLPLGGAVASRAWLGIDNLVAFLLYLADAQIADGTVLHVADREQASVAEMCANLRAALQRPRRLVDIPAPLLRGMLRILGREAVWIRLFGGLQMDTAQTELMGWTPPHSQAQQIAETVAWYRAQHS